MGEVPVKQSWWCEGAEDVLVRLQNARGGQHIHEVGTMKKWLESKK